MSLVKASTLMMRSMKSSSSMMKTDTTNTTKDAVNIITTPPLNPISSPKMLLSNSSNALKTKFESNLEKFATSNNNNSNNQNDDQNDDDEDDGFFLTETNNNNHTPQNQIQRRSTMMMNNYNTRSNSVLLSSLRGGGGDETAISPALNATLPPLLTSQTRLRNPLKRSSHRHVNHLIEACEKRQAEKEKQILIGLVQQNTRAMTPTPTPTTTSSFFGTNNQDNDDKNSLHHTLGYTALKRRHEKQQGHLEQLPVPLRTPDGIQKMIQANKQNNNSSPTSSKHYHHHGEDPSAHRTNQNQDEQNSIAATKTLRIPIETLDYLSEKPRRIKLKSLHLSKKFGVTKILEKEK